VIDTRSGATVNVRRDAGEIMRSCRYAQWRRGGVDGSRQKRTAKARPGGWETGDGAVRGERQ
jgi:hypothetical protein